MTASKSSRARNARAAARSGATRNGGAATGRARIGTADGNENADRNGGVKNGGSRNGGSPRGGAAARDRGGRDGRGAVATLRGGPQRVVRERTAQEDLAEAEPRTGPPLWLQITTFLLVLAGLGVSIYLTVAHFTESSLAGCSETKGLVDCTKVTTSPQSYVFGIPVAVLGLAFYVFAVALFSPWAWRSARREIHLLRIASLVVGIGFVIYLLYAELIVIGSICLYCTSVHVVTFLLFVLTVFSIAVWGLVPRRQPS
jgi:uncharacterized membrane protein